MEPKAFGLERLSAISQHVGAKLPLLSHDVEDENSLFSLTIENATRWNHKLSVYRARQLGWNPTGSGEIFQTLGFLEH